MLHEAIFWLSFLLFPFAGLLIWKAFAASQRWSQIAAILLLFPTFSGIYARFIEPHRLVVAEHRVQLCGRGLPGTLRAAVVSDLHRGRFSNTPSMERIVTGINRTGADLVLMPGDFTNYLDADALDKTFAPLAQLKMQAYAVMGNHDVGLPGPDYGLRLKQALENAGVDVLDPGTEIFGKEGKYLRIWGQRDYWDFRYNEQALGGWPEPGGLPTIVLQHNPDVLTQEPVTGTPLVVSGHTHGGQIRLPGLTCRMTEACSTLRYGYADLPSGGLFVTSGIGMVGLPLRFAVPPKIDVMDIELARCPLEKISPLQL